MNQMLVILVPRQLELLGLTRFKISNPHLRYPITQPRLEVIRSRFVDSVVAGNKVGTISIPPFREFIFGIQGPGC
jgi:hypothetical protein